MTEAEKKEFLFGLVQSYLNNPPLIIWGSGATIPFGLPSMWTLNEVLKEQVDGFDQDCDNLEVELGKDKYLSAMPKIKKLIWNTVNEKDEVILKNLLEGKIEKYNGLKNLIDRFMSAHPKVVNIVTTNYDRVLENVFAYHSLAYSDGFLGKNLSLFDDSTFKDGDNINIIKVHGSLNWFEQNGEIRFFKSHEGLEVPQIICPSKNKFQEAYKSPYRELIQKSDELIKKAQSFLAVGFGFNDEHLTPKIEQNVRKGIPIVVITKEITSSCLKQLENAEKFILIEENTSTTSKFTVRRKIDNTEEYILDGAFWKLSNFNEIF